MQKHRMRLVFMVDEDTDFLLTTYLHRTARGNEDAAHSITYNPLGTPFLSAGHGTAIQRFRCFPRHRCTMPPKGNSKLSCLNRKSCSPPIPDSAAVLRDVWRRYRRVKIIRDCLLSLVVGHVCPKLFFSGSSHKLHDICIYLGHSA